MAVGKVARRTVVADVTALLNSPELSALVAELDESGDKRGRKGYGARALLGACLVKSMFALPTWTFVAALIAEHPGLQDALGGCPSVWAMYRFSVKLRAHSPLIEATLGGIVSALRAELPEYGTDIAIDASDIPAWGNGHRTVYDGGPERERYSDPDASWGHRSAVGTRGAGGFYGFKIDLAVCTATGLPLAWQTRSARHHESLFVAPLLDAVRARGFRPETCAMDKGYDNTRIYGECEARGVDPVVPLRGAKSKQPALPLTTGGRLFPRIARHTERFRSLYRRRALIEKEFAHLKREHGLAALRVRGLERVQLHADLTMLARLSLAMQRERVATLAA
ncbi:MAG TPA: transposase [Dehalococcoidia bacterium]|nr:transposase [Dehalococcoidia bacterium]